MRSLNMADRPRYYVSLGDSMSIDDYAGGSGRGAASLLYENNAADFPDWAGRDLKTHLPGARLVPLARDGATSAAVRYVQLPQLAELGIRASVVTLTMGGNDLLQCFGNGEAARAACRSLVENGHAVLTQLRSLTEPNAPILLGTIYDPSDGTGDTSGLDLLDWPDVLGWIGRFNEAIRKLAGEHGALLADLHTAFHGHGRLSGDSPAQTSSRPANRDLYYCGVVEPNAWGACAIRAVWWDTLRAAGMRHAA